MNRIVFAAVTCVVILSACSQSEKASAPAPPAAMGVPSPEPAPEISSASLYPENPTAATQLIAHYTLRSPGIIGANYTFRWFVDNVLVQEGPVGTLDPGKHFKGSNVYVEIIPSNQQGAGRPAKTNVLNIGNLPPVVSSIALTPIDPPAGVIMTVAASGTDPDGDTVAFTYQWYVNGKPVTDPRKSNEFNTAGLRKKDLLFVVVTPSDGTSLGKDKESDIVVIANSAPQITSVPQYTIQNHTYRYQVTAKDPDGDTLTYNLLTSPPGMTIDSSAGLIEWNVPDTIPEKQEVVIKISADDKDGGTAFQEYSLILDMK